VSPVPCATSVDFWAFRTVRLDETGAPDPGTASLYVCETPVSLQMQPQVSTTNAAEQLDGRGRQCARKPGTSRVQEYALTLQVCAFEPELWELFMGGDLWTDDDDEPIGHAVADPSADDPFGVSLEGWEAAWDGGEQALHDFGSGSANAFLRQCFSKTTWREGDSTMQQGIRVRTLVGSAVVNSAIGNGPLGDWPGTPLGPKAEFYDATPPDGVCGVQALAS
jgi:hypothetical protein